MIHPSSFILHPSFLLRLLALGLLLSCPLGARADIKLSVDAENGATISDIYKLVAHAQSQIDIARVEFRVENKLRFTATSVPYAFDWDTLADTDGSHDVLITAFDTGGRSKSLTLSFTINNEIALGANALARKSQTALAAGDKDAAARYARRALKADPDNLAAIRAQSAVYAAQQDWDKAVSTLEKAKIPEDDADSLDQLASYRMRRALLPQFTDSFATELPAIVALRRKAKEIALAKVKARYTPSGNATVSPEGHAAIGDAMLDAGDIKGALLEYLQCGTEDSVPTPFRNRLALGYIDNEQYTECGRILRPITLEKKDDTATRALDGLLMLRELRFEDARAAVQDDAAAHVPAALIVAAFADLALGKRTEAVTEAREAVHLLPNAGDAQFALAVVSPDIEESERALNRALPLAPFQSGPYLRYATRIALTKEASPERLSAALGIADFVLNSAPENVAAKLLQAMLSLQTGHSTEAESILTALLKRDNASLDILMAGAVYWRVNDQPEKRGAFMDSVRKRFPNRADDMDLITSPLSMLYAMSVKYAYRPYAFLAVTTLYPSP